MLDTIDLPTMFKRGGEENGFKVKPELAEGCEWVKDRLDILLTIKVDGTLCKVAWKPIDMVKTLYRKMGDVWFLCDRDHPMDKWLWEAYDNCSKNAALPEGFYVAYGPSINGNPQDAAEHSMVRIGPADAAILIGWTAVDIKRGTWVPVEAFFESIKKELEDSTVAGFVFQWEQPQMQPFKFAQITRKDLGLSWPIHKVAERNALTDPTWEAEILPGIVVP